MSKLQQQLTEKEPSSRELWWAKRLEVNGTKWPTSLSTRKAMNLSLKPRWAMKTWQSSKQTGKTTGNHHSGRSQCLMICLILKKCLICNYNCFLVIKTLVILLLADNCSVELICLNKFFKMKFCNLWFKNLQKCADFVLWNTSSRFKKCFWKMLCLKITGKWYSISK